MKKHLFDFIKKREPNLKSVTSFKVKDTDDEDGYIGESYIVECLVTGLNPMSTTGYQEDVKRNYIPRYFTK